MLEVKVIEVDERGRVNVSRKDLLPKPEGDRRGDGPRPQAPKRHEEQRPQSRNKPNPKPLVKVNDETIKAQQEVEHHKNKGFFDKLKKK